MAITVTPVPISQLGAADLPLAGDELVPLVQNGVTRQTSALDLAAVQADMPQATVKGRQLAGGVGPPLNLTQAELTALVTGLVNAQLANMADATIKGRALSAGAGVPTDLTAAQALNVVMSALDDAARETYDIGFLRQLVQVLGTVQFDLVLVDCGYYFFVAADAAQITVPSEASDDLGDGFIFSVGVGNAAGTMQVIADAGVTILNLSTGETITGPAFWFLITGIGCATCWKVGTNLWHLNGVNAVAAS